MLTAGFARFPAGSLLESMTFLWCTLHRRPHFHVCGGGLCRGGCRYHGEPVQDTHMSLYLTPGVPVFLELIVCALLCLPHPRRMLWMIQMVARIKDEWRSTGE